MATNSRTGLPTIESIMSSRRRPRRSYVEVSDSDSDDDFLIPESTNSMQDAEDVHLKKPKASSGDRETNGTTSIPEIGATKAASEHGPSKHPYVVDIDASESQIVVQCSPPSGCEDKNDGMGTKWKNPTEKRGDNVTSKVEDKVFEGDDDSDSDIEIRWRKSGAIGSVARGGPSEISKDHGNHTAKESVSARRKRLTKYVDDSDGSFDMESRGGESDSEDSSSDFEIEQSKQPKSVKKKVPSQRKNSTSANVVVKSEKQKYRDDSDASFSGEDDESNAEDSLSEIEIEEPKKANSAGKKAPAGQKAVLKKQAKNPVSKGVPRQMSLHKAASKPVSKGVQKPASKASRSGAGGPTMKRLGARPVLKPLLSKKESAGDGSQRLGRASRPLASASGPRYRSGLSRKHPISTRLHAYLTPP